MSIWCLFSPIVLTDEELNGLVSLSVVDAGRLADDPTVKANAAAAARHIDDVIVEQYTRLPLGEYAGEDDDMGGTKPSDPDDGIDE